MPAGFIHSRSTCHHWERAKKMFRHTLVRLLVLSMALTGIFLLTTCTSRPSTPTPTPTPTATPTTVHSATPTASPGSSLRASDVGRHALGPAQAPVAMVDVADFQ